MLGRVFCADGGGPFVHHSRETAPSGPGPPRPVPWGTMGAASRCRPAAASAVPDPPLRARAGGPAPGARCRQPPRNAQRSSRTLAVWLIHGRGGEVPALPLGGRSCHPLSGSGASKTLRNRAAREMVEEGCTRIKTKKKGGVKIKMHNFQVFGV